MIRALRTAALGMSAQQSGVDNIANNLANANTTGYKRSTIVFQDLLYQNVQTPGLAEAQGGQTGTLQMGHGAAAIATVRTFTQGGLTETGNALDLAIHGDGFIPLHRPVFEGNEKQYLVDCIDSNFVSSVGAKVIEFEQHIAAFTGIVPAEDPQLSIIVVIDEPTTSIYGGTAAAPVFASPFTSSPATRTASEVPPDRPARPVC